MKNYYYHKPPIGAEIVIVITQPWVMDDVALSSWIPAAGTLKALPTETVGKGIFVLFDEYEKREEELIAILPVDEILWDYLVTPEYRKALKRSESTLSTSG